MTKPLGWSVRNRADLSPNLPFFSWPRAHDLAHVIPKMNPTSSISHGKIPTKFDSINNSTNHVDLSAPVLEH